MARDSESSLQMGNMADISGFFVIGKHFLAWNTAQSVIFWSFSQSCSSSNSGGDTLSYLVVWILKWTQMAYELGGGGVLLCTILVDASV